MTGWRWLATVLIAGGLVPCLVVTCRGRATERLLGLALAGPVAVMVLAVLAVDSGQSSQFIVPLVLAALTFTGSLMVLRLLGRAQ